MPKEIYNEGRVVGYSSYEVYVKQHASEDPNTPPASEREWLASSLGSGSSMLLKVTSDTVVGSHYRDIQFPETSNLCAANTIIACFFSGEGNYVSGSLWANKVTDYGNLISNTSASSPNGVVGPTGNVPTGTIAKWSDAKKQSLKAYLNLVDGIIIQPGTWSSNTSSPPAKDFKIDLKNPPRIRLFFSDKVETEFQILLTGFTIRSVVSGETGLDSAVNTPSPDDGDFLGPGQYPWANKIMISVPTSVMNYFFMERYRRKLPTSSSEIKVDDNAVIDMRTTKPETFYSSNFSNSRVPLNVTDYSTLGEGTAVLTTYQRDASYAPAMYGTYVTSTGSKYLNPIDTTAPGTVKMFPGESLARLQGFETSLPNNYVFTRDSNYIISHLNASKTLVPISKVESQELSYTNEVASDTKARGILTTTGNLKQLSLSMYTSSGSQYTLSQNPASTLKTSGDNIYWSALLEALANNKKIDILGTNLKTFKTSLPDIVSTGVLRLTGTGTSSVGGAFTAQGNLTSLSGGLQINNGIINSNSGPVKFNQAVRVGANYIEFNNNLRLYISSSNPGTSGVPVGSIGIGW